MNAFRLAGAGVGVFFACLLPTAFGGPVDRAGSWADAAGTPQAADVAARAARTGAQLPGRTGRKVAPRAAAWISVGRLGVLNEEVLESAEGALMAEYNASAVRATCAWALGELSRGRSWQDVRPISDVLQRAMTVPLSAEAAYGVVEAFGKVYTPHDHTFEENLAASKALNTLAANQNTQMPAIYYVVVGRVVTLDVAIHLLRDELAEARRSRTEQNLAEAYNAVLTTVRWLAARQEQLINGFGNQKSTIESAFDALLGALDLNDRSTTLILMWSLGNISAEPVFAEMVGNRASVVAHQADPLVRVVTAWSLHRLSASGDARQLLRQEFLGKEVDAQVLRMLAAMRTAEAAPDVVQRLYQVPTNVREERH